MADHMRKGNVVLWLILVLAIVAVSAIFWKLRAVPQPSNTVVTPQTTQLIAHTSKDLKISLKYPNGWIIDDRYRKVLLANFSTNLNRDDKPDQPSLRLIISNASLCQETLDQDVLLGGCGEGTSTKSKILSRSEKTYTSGKLIVYEIMYTTGSKDTLYYFVNIDRVLQISKQPDPSQFEKEFDQIVSSITFL